MGGPEEQLADSLYRVNYAVTKRGIYYMAHADESGNCMLKFYDFATGATSPVLAMGRPEFGLDVSPDWGATWCMPSSTTRRAALCWSRTSDEDHAGTGRGFRISPHKLACGKRCVGALAWNSWLDVRTG